MLRNFVAVKASN
jgi:hypothetical protein